MRENFAKTGLFLQSGTDISAGMGKMYYCAYVNNRIINAEINFIRKFFKTILRIP